MIYSYSVYTMILLFGVIPSTTTAQIDWETQMDNVIETGMQYWSVPGLSIAIVNKDEVLFIKGYGLRDIDRQEKVTPQTIFPIGSLSKGFTTAALGILVDEQELAWDDNIKNHNPEFYLQSSNIEHLITVRDLLTHRTGLTNNNLGWFAGGFDRTQINGMISDFNLQHGFRSKFEYNNTVFAYSATLIQQKKNISWDQYIKRELFEPLGMNASSTNFDGLRNSENKATAYTVIDEGIEEIPYRNLDNIGPSGAINSNAEDLAKWIRLHLNKGVMNGDTLLNTKTISEIHAPHVLIPKQEATLFFPEANFITYGLGWFVHDYKGELVVEHSGNIDGMSAHIAMLPKKNIGVAVLTNLNANFLPFAIKNRVFDIVLDEPEFDWNQAFKQSFDKFIKVRDQIVNEPPAIENKLSPSLNLSHYTGQYISKSSEQLDIKMEQESLKLTYGKSSGLLTHLNYNTFLIEWKDPMIKNSFGSTTVTFLISKSGDIDKINIDGIGIFKKIKQIKKER